MCELSEYRRTIYKTYLYNPKTRRTTPVKYTIDSYKYSNLAKIEKICDS